MVTSAELQMNRSVSMVTSSVTQNVLGCQCIVPEVGLGPLVDALCGQ